MYQDEMLHHCDKHHINYPVRVIVSWNRKKEAQPPSYPRQIRQIIFIGNPTGRRRPKEINRLHGLNVRLSLDPTLGVGVWKSRWFLSYQITIVRA